jgi:uncharacterized protein DUF3303
MLQEYYGGKLRLHKRRIVWPPPPRPTAQVRGPAHEHWKGWQDTRGKMLFMVIEHFRPGRAPDVYRRFRDRGRLAPEDVRYVSSWVDLDFRRCFQVMEAESEARIREWTAKWDDLIEFEIVPVRTSAEAAATIGPEL